MEKKKKLVRGGLAREQKLRASSDFVFFLSLALSPSHTQSKLDPFLFPLPPPPRAAPRIQEKMQSALAQRSALAPLSARPASARRAPRAAAQASASRPLWVPGTKAPAHLTGTLAGDRGFDPLVSERRL